MKQVQCKPGQNVFDACAEHYGREYKVVIWSGGVPSPEASGMVGVVSVRPRERFAVVPRRER
jgi:hypothetical protein